MNDKLDELHLIYKMIGAYGFCTVKELLEKYDELQNINDKLSSALNSAEQRIDKAIEYITNVKKIDNYLDGVPCDELLSILKGEQE